MALVSIIHATVCTVQSNGTALMRAADGGHTETVQALAALGADIHIKDIVSPGSHLIIYM